MRTGHHGTELRMDDGIKKRRNKRITGEMACQGWEREYTATSVNSFDSSV
jgi:hypothetical protein